MHDSHYAAHVERLQHIAEGVLESAGFDALVIGAGLEALHHADDQPAGFRATPHLRWWAPLDGPGHVLVVRQGRRPALYHHAPPDYWYEHRPLGAPAWAAHFDVFEAGDVRAARDGVPPAARVAWLGPGRHADEAGFGEAAREPAAVVAPLDWARSYKSEYEIACVSEATRRAAPAHRAARAAFLAGASELEIHQAYVAAARCTDHALPYESIVALDEKAAFLHYVGKRTRGGGKVLLIDSGAVHRGYACDVTRTWHADGVDARFAALVAGLAGLQGAMCESVAPGPDFLDLHRASERRVAALLGEIGVLRTGPDEALERGLTRAFYPHGLGHFLGIQVHDVAGRQRGRDGGAVAPPADVPHLRVTRALEPGHLVTIEPGVYFIAMLLEPLRNGPDRDAVDWSVVDALAPLGGARIEDNVVVTASGFRNLTREWLAEPAGNG